MVTVAEQLAALLDCHIHTARRILIEGPGVIRSRRIRERAPAALATLGLAPADPSTTPASDRAA